MASVSRGGTPTTFVALFEQLALNGMETDQIQLKTLYPQEDHLTMTELFGVALAARKNMWKEVGEDWMRLVSLEYDSNLIDRICPVFLRILAAKEIDLPQASFEALKRTAKDQKLESRLPLIIVHLPPKPSTKG
ncbi:MAG: hypothetical protein LLG04_01185 [Parachlamydia sp.]|nr:hypothetical protein [Parachlamydia sp.]